MKKMEQAIVDYLETYGQPQTMQAILDHLTELGYKEHSWADVEALVADKVIQHADGGVGSRGEPILLYAPNS